VVADLVALLFPASLFENNIPRELTTGHTSEQNAVVERANRTIMKGVRSSLYHSQLSMSFWAEELCILCTHLMALLLGFMMILHHSKSTLV
jgi:hypothetical protein